MKATLSLTLLLLIPFISIAQASWNEVLPYNNGGRYDDVFFLNENLGWAAGSGGYIYKTIDGGQNWEMQLHLQGYYIRNIEFLNENIGFFETQFTPPSIDFKSFPLRGEIDSTEPNITSGFENNRCSFHTHSPLIPVW